MERRLDEYLDRAIIAEHEAYALKGIKDSEIGTRGVEDLILVANELSGSRVRYSHSQILNRPKERTEGANSYGIPLSEVHSYRPTWERQCP